MPRADRWEGISERLGLSWSLISTGTPSTEEDYDFIRENRNAIDFVEAPRGVADRFGLPREPKSDVLEEPEMPYEALRPNQVPVVSWASAGAATSYEEIPKDWQRTIFTMCKARGSFGIEVEGDSMVPEFRPGDVVVVMPEMEPRNHAPVVAKLKDDGVVLKIYTRSRDGATITLTSMNPAYAPLVHSADDFHWIYPVHSATRGYWK